MSGARPVRIWIVVDACVWISRYIRADRNHVASGGWLHQHLNAGNRIAALTLLLPEVAGAIARRTGQAAAGEHVSQQLRRLPGVRWIGLGGELGDLAVHLAATLRLRGTDSVYVALADRMRIPLVTWDNEQLTRPRPLIVTGTP
jgi:predicted nucleic acid-binding protein